MRTVTLCACLAFGCSSATPPDIQPLVSGLAAAVVLGQSASWAMQAMVSSTSCTAVKTACTAFPCEGAVTVTYGGACQPSLGGDVSGTAEITGTWASADAATLSSSFAGVMPSLAVVTATGLDVLRTGVGFDVQYNSQDIQTRDGKSALPAVWQVSGGQNNTPSDPSDDDYFIRGNNGSPGSAPPADVQIWTSDIPVLAHCRRNPTGGAATLQNVQVRFHQECDGQAEAGGQLVPVDF